MNPGSRVTSPVRRRPDSGAAWRPKQSATDAPPRGKIRIGQSNARNPVEAVHDLQRQLAQPSAGLVIVFCSPSYDLDRLATEIDHAFAGIPVVGCTTAGEIGPVGYIDSSLSGVSLPSDCFTTVTGRLDRVRQSTTEHAEAFAGRLLGQLEDRAPRARESDMFAFQLVDGLCMREELITNAFQHALGRVPLVGGSAGDAEDFGHTHVLSEGRFHEDSAVLVVAATPLPFMTFSTRHFVSTEQRAVVTSADPATRTVVEIDALPAVEGYAQLVGASADKLDPAFFSSHPVVVRIGGADHSRSIQKVNPDGSLTFFCAIEEGVVLRAAVMGDLLADLQAAFEHVRNGVGTPSLVLACDCVLRTLEISKAGLSERVADLFRRHNAVGFSTYGEQLRGVHMNQTLTGLAFGRGEES